MRCCEIQSKVVWFYYNLKRTSQPKHIDCLNIKNKKKFCCCVRVLYLYKLCALSPYNRSNNNNTSQNTTIHKTIFTFKNTREDVDNYSTMFCDHNPHMAICRVVFSPAYLETSRWWQTQRAAHLKSCETPSPSDIKSTSVAFIRTNSP